MDIETFRTKEVSLKSPCRSLNLACLAKISFGNSQLPKLNCEEETEFGHLNMNEFLGENKTECKSENANQ